MPRKQYDEPKESQFPVAPVGDTGEPVCTRAAGAAGSRTGERVAMTGADDAIDTLAGLSADSALRALRPSARDYAQKSYETLFLQPAEGMMPLAERLAIACFIAALHQDVPTMKHYGAMLQDSPAAPLSAAIAAAADAGATEGPYGAFPPGPLSAEDVPGIHYAADTAALGPRLAAAFKHAHLLVFHPRDAGRTAIGELVSAGWSSTEIVTLSQLISFLTFQIRTAAGLRVLAAAKRPDLHS